MAREVWLIRHAQSTANAGLVAGCDPATPPLTETGRAQARDLARAFDRAPDLIVVSPYLRTRETAAPTIARFPSVPIESWPVHELTYLAPARCTGLNTIARRPMVDEYWRRCDPMWIDGEGAESFSQVLKRVRDLDERLAARPSPFIAVFTHGHFIRACQLLREHPEATDVDLMARFWPFARATRVPNGAVIRFDRLADARLANTKIL